MATRFSKPLFVLFLIVPTTLADDSFERRIRPVLVEHCFHCHGEKQQKGGIRLDAPEYLKFPEDGSEPLINMEKLGESRLIQVLRYDGEVKMPPKGKLSKDTITDLEKWVNSGAKWPSAHNAPVKGKEHWAFQSVKNPTIPPVKNTTWSAEPIDQFIIAGLESKGLSPSPEASRAVLLRRLSFDLTGLPPTAEEVSSFGKDSSPEAYEKLVDKLLASPRFGERWARHWMDIARYSDTPGGTNGKEDGFLFAYTYRDWLIKAFNEDLPYDQFLIRQIAADQLTRTENHPDLAALGFLTLGKKFDDNEPDIIDDRMDVVFRGTQALTLACARCHNHKYDPIPIKDYYSIYGVFAGARETEVPLISTAEERGRYLAYASELRSRERNLARFVDSERKRAFGNYLQQLDRYLLAVNEGAGEPKEGTARADGLNQVIVGLCSNLLEETKNEHNPILAPWHAFAKLKPDQFATEGKRLALDIVANENAEKAVAPLVAKLFAGKPPTNLAEVAGRYGRLFGSIARKWERKIAEADRADNKRPVEFEDEDEEEIRKFLFDEGRLEVSLGDLPEYIGEELDQKLKELQNRIQEFNKGAGVPPHARILEDPAEMETQKVFIRGKPDQLGEEAPRQFLGILTRKERKPFANTSGRLDLAKEIASKDNPLTARVWSNRVWAHLFGRGIVETTSDFGNRSTPPTHPELLDFLANALIENGWSTKKLIRQIVLSQVYRQASFDRAEPMKTDPANSLFWRMNRKRLEIEALRDAFVAVSGSMETSTGGAPVDLDQQPLTLRRAIYLKIDRSHLPGLFQSFDFANPNLHTPRRHETIVPQQALFLLNSPFAKDRARAAAINAGKGKPADDATWLRSAYANILGRDPSSEEVSFALKFLVRAAQLKITGPQAPEGPWHYGYGEWNSERKQLVSFHTFQHFQDGQWRPGREYPDSKRGYAALDAEGGSPGENKGTVAVRRWVAPANGVVSIESQWKHAIPEGENPGDADGVRAMVSIRGKVMAEMDFFRKEGTHSQREVPIRAGESIDFIVDPKANDSYDSFVWKIDLSFKNDQSVKTEIGFSSVDDFRGPLSGSESPLNPREKFAQVLLMSNEFLFLD